MIVTVVYVLPDRQHVLRAEVAEGTTIGEAIIASGLLALEPVLQNATPQVGVWNRKAAWSAPARDGDRIEVYRSLTVDPKEARRIRADVRRRRRAPKR